MLLLELVKDGDCNKQHHHRMEKCSFLCFFLFSVTKQTMETGGQQGNQLMTDEVQVDSHTINFHATWG